MNFWLTVSTNEVSTRFCHKWIDFFPFLAQVFVCLILIGGRISSKREMVFLFRSRDSSFFAKYCVPWPPNQKKNVLSVFVVLTCSCNIDGTLRTNNESPHFPQSKMDLGVVTASSRDWRFPLLTKYLPGQILSPITSWIHIELSSKMRTSWPKDEKKDFI